MSSKQIVEPTEEINILLRRTAVPKCDITPAVKGLITLSTLMCDNIAPHVQHFFCATVKSCIQN